MYVFIYLFIYGDLVAKDLGDACGKCSLGARAKYLGEASSGKAFCTDLLDLARQCVHLS